MDKDVIICFHSCSFVTFFSKRLSQLLHIIISAVLSVDLFRISCIQDVAKRQGLHTKGHKVLQFTCQSFF